MADILGDAQPVPAFKRHLAAANVPGPAAPVLRDMQGGK